MSGSATESLGLRLAALVALVLANAFFVAAEFALVAARRTRIEALVRRGDRKAKTVQTALQDLYRQLSAAQLGITVASIDRKSTRLNSSHLVISYAVFCLKKK